MGDFENAKDTVPQSGLQFNYRHEDMVDVIANPTEYIIPECLPACKALWGKNIPTFMTSNYDDPDIYYILLGAELSDQNIEIFEKQKSLNPHNYFFDGFRQTRGIQTDRSVKIPTKEATQRLLLLTNPFIIQDTKKYLSIEEFLDQYKQTGGKPRVDSYGYIHFDENPGLANITFEQALKASGKKVLYIPQEGRIYDNELYLKWHNRFLDSKKQMDDTGIEPVTPSM